MTMRSEYLPFALPDVDQREWVEIKETLDSGWLTTGGKVRLFEEKFAEAVGAQYAVAVNSCTAAMHLALEAIGLTQGDEVITTPYTFAATAEVIRYFGALPVFVDIEPKSLNIRADLIKQKIAKRTRAIIPVHIGGFPVEMDAIMKVAESNHLPVIEDAAHAFQTRYKDRTIGSVGDLTCFSFYATKPITTGEGGMICTGNEEWATRCRVMSLHGISHDAWKRYTREGSWYYEIIAPGYKYNMTDIAAAMGLAQLSKADRMLQRRREIAQKYNRAFQEHPTLQVPYDNEDCRHAWHLYPLRLHLDRLTIDRSEFIQELQQRNIGTSVHYMPLHVHPYYKETYGYKTDDFPAAYSEYLREVSLPIYSKMSEEDVQDVVEAVIEVITKFGK